MKQIKQLVMTEHTRAVVLCENEQQPNVIINCVLSDIINGDGGGWRGTAVKRSQWHVGNENLNSIVTFYIVRDPKEVRQHLSGLNITNILYTQGVTGDVLYSLKSLMRSAEFKGIFSIEPVWWEDV